MARRKSDDSSKSWRTGAALQVDDYPTILDDHLSVTPMGWEHLLQLETQTMLRNSAALFTSILVYRRHKKMSFL